MHCTSEFLYTFPSLDSGRKLGFDAELSCRIGLVVRHWAPESRDGTFLI